MLELYRSYGKESNCPVLMLYYGCMFFLATLRAYGAWGLGLHCLLVSKVQCRFAPIVLTIYPLQWVWFIPGSHFGAQYYGDAIAPSYSMILTLNTKPRATYLTVNSPGVIAAAVVLIRQKDFLDGLSLLQTQPNMKALC